MPIPRLKITESTIFDIDYTQLSKDLAIDTNKYYEKPPICIEITQHGERFRFGTLGNFSVVGGKGKSRKTFFISALLGAALGNSSVLSIVADFKEKEIVFFDTEQSEYDLFWAAKRATSINGISHPDNYKVFCLRSLSPPERLSFIDTYLNQNNNVGYIVIDGIRDLLTDINNTDQSTEIVTKLMQWTKIYNIHATVVLHENPSSDKLRGHLGTEITNKAETVISIEKPLESPNISRVIPRFIRGTKEFADYAFEINEKGLPIICEYIGDSF